MKRRVLVLAAPLGIALLACSLTDLSGFAVGTPGDAGAVGPSGRDGGGEAGGSPDDAGPDAAAAGGWCATRSPAPEFCEDFDGADAGVASWEKLSVTSPNRLDVVGDVFRSPPRSLSAMFVPPVASLSRAMATKHVTSHARLQVGAELQLSNPGGGDSSLLQVALSPPPPDWEELGVSLDAYGDDLVLVVFKKPIGGSSSSIDVPVTVGLTSWRRLVLDVDPRAKLARVLDAAGTVLASAAFPDVKPFGFDVLLGLEHYHGDAITKPWRLSIDDFAITVVD